MIIQCDGSALEWRICCELAQEPTGIKEILEKQDVHSLNEATFKLPSRLIAKKYLFRTIFNHGNGYAFTVDPEFMHVSTSVKFWDGIGEAFYTKYSGIDALYTKNARLVAAGKPIVGPLGREWPIKMTTNWKGEMAIPETLLVNYPTQGTGADVMMIARISFWNRLKKMGLSNNVKLITTVHDSIVVDAPSEYLNTIVKLFYDVFADLPANIKKLFGYEWKVPLACECKAGPNMKNQEKVYPT